MTHTSNQSIQIRVLYDQGYTPQQIASGLGLNEEAVTLVIKGFNVGEKKYNTLKERFGDLEEIAMVALIEVCENSENHSAKAMAAKILLERKEAINSKIEFDYEMLANRLNKAKEASSESKIDNIVEMNEVVNN